MYNQKKNIKINKPVQNYNTVYKYLKDLNHSQTLLLNLQQSQPIGTISPVDFLLKTHPTPIFRPIKKRIEMSQRLRKQD